MTKLKLSALLDDRPVKITVELTESFGGSVTIRNVAVMVEVVFN